MNPGKYPHNETTFKQNSRDETFPETSEILKDHRKRWIFNPDLFPARCKMFCEHMKMSADYTDVFKSTPAMCNGSLEI
jgi:hypothetical protein